MGFQLLRVSISLVCIASGIWHLGDFWLCSVFLIWCGVLGLIDTLARRYDGTD